MSSAMESEAGGQSTDVLTLEDEEGKKKKPKFPIIYEDIQTDILNPMGIFSTGDGFECLICNRDLKVLGGCRSHANGKEHRKKFTQIINRSSRVESNGLYVCKLCTDNVEMDWKKYLLHFNELNHLDLNSTDKKKPKRIRIKKPEAQKFSVILLERWQIIRYKRGIYFCCCCGEIMGGWKSIVDHVDDREHREKQEDRVYDHKGENSQVESQKLVFNYISHISKTIYYCYLCERSISGGREDCHQHINGDEHKKFRVKLRDGNEEEHIIKFQPLSEKLKQIEKPTPITAEAVQNTISKSLAELMRANLITGLHNNRKCLCKLCGVDIDFPNILEHVSGKRHEKKMVQARGKTPLEYESEGISGSLSSSYVSIEKSSYSWKSYNDELESLQSSEDSSRLLSWENLDNGSSGSWEKVDIKTSVTDSHGPEPFEVPEHFVPLIDKNLLQKKTKEYFCVSCKAHLRDLRSLLDHTNTKKHVSRLERFRAKATSKNRKLLATSESTSIASSPVNPPIEKPSLKDEEPADTPEQETTPIPLEPHVLKQFEDDILCLACNDHFTDVNDYMVHIRGESHRATLDKYRSELPDKAENNARSMKKDTAINSSIFDAEEKPSTENSQTIEKTAKTTTNISEHFKDDILCMACNIHFTDVDKYFVHINSERHQATLDKYWTGLLVEEKSTATTLKESSISALDEKPSTSNSQNIATAEETTNPQNPQSSLMDLPEHVLPLIAIHSLNHLEEFVYCPACKVQMKDAGSVVSHTNGRKHSRKVKLYTAKTSSQDAETGLSAEDNTTATTMKENIATNSILAFDEKPSCSNFQNIPPAEGTTTPQNPESSLMQLSDHVLPLIAIHSLNHLEKFVYCPACEVQMRRASAVVMHTNGSKHARKLKLYKTKTSSQNTGTLQGLDRSVAEALRELELVKQTLTRESDPKLRITGLASLSQKISVLETSVNKLTIADLMAEDSDTVNKELSQKTWQSSNNRRMNWKELQRQDNNQTRGRGFDPNVDMKHIYKEDPEKLRILKLSCQLSFPKTSEEIYCLVCEGSVSIETQKFYEHLSGNAHRRYLNEMVEYDKRFILYPEQFSDLTLAKEFIQQTSVEETLQCLACDTIIENDDLVISEHSKQDSHKERKRVWNLMMDRCILPEILGKIERTWYNIQKYWCQPCGRIFNTEFDFDEHMNTSKHDRTLIEKGALSNRLTYDGCVSCATLWLGFDNVYTVHCNDPMHRYLLQTGDYSVCKLPGQVKTLLENSEVEVDKLIEQSDPVLTVQKAKVDILLKCLEDTVKPAFPNAKAHPFGSRVSGLGFPDSDIDVFLDCGTYNGDKNTEKLERKIIESVENCLLANQRSWEIDETLTSSRTPIIKLRHRSTELNCDVSFKNGLSVENTRLLKCFIDNYPLCRKLMLFIKKWLFICNLSGSQYITNYAICWYVVFYLQSKSILPSVASMIAKKNESKIIDGWETGICETFDECQEEYTFAELLHGFFLFYANFDYHYSVACPILGITIPKRDFAELDLLPKEMKPYVNRIKSKRFNGPVELFRIDSEMCIQDPYDLSHNLTKAVKKFTLNRFKRLCAASVDVLDNF